MMQTCSRCKGKFWHYLTVALCDQCAFPRLFPWGEYPTVEEIPEHWRRKR